MEISRGAGSIPTPLLTIFLDMGGRLGTTDTAPQQPDLSRCTDTAEHRMKSM
jgi:hypothetical protein